MLPKIESTVSMQKKTAKYSAPVVMFGYTLRLQISQSPLCLGGLVIIN